MSDDQRTLMVWRNELYQLPEHERQDFIDKAPKKVVKAAGRLALQGYNVRLLRRG